ncbi:hypothetical protein S101447_01653 [Acetobacter ascendens]|uniref:Uncharacterized protein n=1 Tax=Acetobacter ascendens TaxID=481146 RepID=A0A1Y0UYT5_9PROT|nr:hypothetical protein S101447_01653 [Acetobacter ascendens]
MCLMEAGLLAWGYGVSDLLPSQPCYRPVASRDRQQAQPPLTVAGAAADYEILLQYEAETRARHSLSSRLRSTIHLFENIF